MKKRPVALLILFLSAIGIANPVPEATNLDSEKYTLRFVLATGEGSLFKSEKGMSESSKKAASTNSWVTCRGKEPVVPACSPVVLLLDQARATYSEVSSFTVDMGGEFSSRRVTGKIEGEANGELANTDPFHYLSFTFQHHDRSIKVPKIRLTVGEWSCVALSSSNQVDYVMIKLYEPQK